MNAKTALLLTASLALIGMQALAAEPSPKSSTQAATKSDDAANASPDHGVLFNSEASPSEGSVTVEGQRIDYHAVAGTIVVHPKGWDDAANHERVALGDKPAAADAAKDDSMANNPKAEAAMFYVAYFKKGAPSPDRPITFLYNGGPGSSTVWLHMGAFGPRRVVTKDDSHTPAAPYQLIDNAYSLLDASDLVFIDAPGAGFSRIAGKDKEKAFWGTDADAYAFGEFVMGFLSKYGRWNSPKYLFGESYGTTRSAALAAILQNEKALDLNGILLLSQILSFDNSADAPQFNPGVDLPYVLALPTYAATAWYHHKLPGPVPALEPLLREVEVFALSEYAQALAAGTQLSAERRSAMAARLHEYTGLPADYIERANLRVNGGEFEKTLLGSETTTGRLDTRFAGPTIDPMSKEADYDPQSAALSSAYVSVFNDYVRGTLKFGARKIYKPVTDVARNWDFLHQPPGAEQKIPGTTNVMPDLAVAMKQNPHLEVQLNAGYYDLATPYFAAVYELHQLPIQPALQGHIEMHFYSSGHMVYAHEPDLKALHANAAAFIERTQSGAVGH